jgi:hypothetical protein
MAEDDEEVRASRAEKLRERISRLKKQDEEGDEESSSQPEHARPGKSPREFIEERMRELDEQEDRPDGSKH